jgi:hypothetical protein
MAEITHDVNGIVKRRVTHAAGGPPETCGRPMHPSAQRLLDVARQTAGVEGHSDLARRLNVAPQSVTNWTKRGVSVEAAVVAQQILGVSAVWVLHGEPPVMVQPGNPRAVAHAVEERLPPWPIGTPRAAPSVADLVQQLARVLDTLSSDRIVQAQAALHALAMAPDSAKACAAVTRALQGPAGERSKPHPNAA